MQPKLTAYSIVFITPIAFQRISWRTWIILAATNFAILPLIYFFYPETAFRSLEEVDVIFQLADDESGNPWLNVVRISQSEPLWFGKKGEKREGFNYANTSWHKRLLHSSGSSNSGSGSGGEKASYGTTTSGDQTLATSNSDPDTIAMPMDQESPIDPALSPTTTVTTTIRSDRKPNKLRKKSSYNKATQQPFGPGVAPPPERGHNRTRSTSSESIHSVRPEWWTEDLAPAPLSLRSRDSRAFSLRHVPSNEVFRHDQDRDQDEYAYNGTSSFHAHSVDHRDDSASLSSYPGIIGGGEERQGRPTGVVRTESMRSTYLPDGVYEVREGRVRSLSLSSQRRWEARDAGRAA